VFAVRCGRVRTLPERDVAALAAVTARLVALDDADPFPPRILGLLAALVSSQSADYCELDRAHEVGLSFTWWDEAGGGRSDGQACEEDGYWRLRHQHPLCAYRERTNDWISTRKVSDFATDREFRGSEIWNELYRDDRVHYWIDVGLRSAGRQTSMFIFTRNRRDFTECDRLVLDLLQPHLQQRYDRVKIAADAADALASLEEDHDADDPRHVVLCSNNGVIEFASPQSRHLLASYLQCANGRVPLPLLRALRGRTQPIVIERDGQRLTLRAAASAGLIVLLLGEDDLRLDRLTPRQRTILSHVAQGRTDANIASSLGIAPATVNKHLEQIYHRLGVHTRTAAAAAVSASGPGRLR
jgi:DNA-binding CsgD family transcriptional regulator